MSENGKNPSIKPIVFQLIIVAVFLQIGVVGYSGMHSQVISQYGTPFPFISETITGAYVLDLHCHPDVTYENGFSFWSLVINVLIWAAVIHTLAVLIRWAFMRVSGGRVPAVRLDDVTFVFLIIINVIAIQRAYLYLIFPTKMPFMGYYSGWPFSTEAFWNKALYLNAFFIILASLAVSLIRIKLRYREKEDNVEFSSDSGDSVNPVDPVEEEAE